MTTADASAHGNRQIARDVSYSYSARTRGGRVMMRVMENFTGLVRLIRRAGGYETEAANGNDFRKVMLKRYGLSPKVVHGSLENIPSAGPLVLFANDPCGIIDGLSHDGPYTHVGSRRFQDIGAQGVSQSEGYGRLCPANRL